MASEQSLAEQQQPPPPPPLRPPSPPRIPVPEPPVIKLTRGHSCVLCQQRKVRCDKQKPCANCVKAQVECRVVPPQPPRRRKKKPHERDLIERLRKYESLLAQHGVNFEPIAHELKPSDHGDDVADLEQDLSGLKTSPSSTADHASPDQGLDRLVLSLWLYSCLFVTSLTLLFRQRWAAPTREVSHGFVSSISTIWLHLLALLLHYYLTCHATAARLSSSQHPVNIFSPRVHF